MGPMAELDLLGALNQKRWKPDYCRAAVRRGSLGHAATPRLPSPLVKPDVPISASGFPTGFTSRLSAAWLLLLG